MRIVRACLLPTLLSLLVGGIALSANHVPFRTMFVRTPAIHVNRQFDLGVHVPGRAVEGRFTVANPGGEQLVIDELRKSCGCLGVYRFGEDGKRYEFQRLEIPPGQAIELGIQFVATGQSGDQISHYLTFQTNVPNDPEVRLDFRVQIGGAVSASPSSFHFANVRLGQNPSTEIEIRDDTLDGCVLEKAITSAPERFRVRLVPCVGETGDPANAKLGRLIGRVEVSLLPTDRSERIYGEVMVFVRGKGSPVLTIPVSGTVRGTYELLPGEVRLPRQSTSGPLYSAVCLCRRSDGQEFSLLRKSAPPDVDVSVENAPNNPSTKFIRVTFRGKPPEKGPFQCQVRLIARRENTAQELVLKLTIIPLKLNEGP